MAYSVYLDGVLFPVAPSKLKLQINNQNQTMQLMDEGEVNLIKEAGLTQVQLELLLPQTHYPFAVYPDGFQGASYYLEKLERLKIQKRRFRFIVSRMNPQGELPFDTNLKVTLESYEVTEDAQNGLDIMVSVTLKQYRDFATKTVEVTESQATVNTPRETDNAPEKESHKVVKGDCLWNIAQRYLGDGAKYPALYAANQSTIDGGNRGTGNPKYTIYPGQVLTIP